MHVHVSVYGYISWKRTLRNVAKIKALDSDQA